MQLLVEDPEAFVLRLKQRLQLKEGIPENQQRLIFSVPSFEAGEPEVAASEQAAEEFVGDLKSWKVWLWMLKISTVSSSGKNLRQIVRKLCKQSWVPYLVLFGAFYAS